MNGHTSNKSDGRTVVIVGLGNVGSQLAGHLARMPKVKRIICVDPDVYTDANRTAQEICDRDVNVAKATAAARRLRRIRDGLHVTAIVDRVENVPRGWLRADLICGCGDSKSVRAAINLIARRLRIPYVDAGIRAQGLLARVDVYGPREEDACMACGFSQNDYETMGRTYSCAGEFREAPNTEASSALGGVAAALQAMECAKVLDSGGPCVQAGRQVVIEAECHHVLVNQLRRNPACWFDHRERPILRQRAATLGELASVGAKLLGGASVAIAVETKSWVKKVVCRGCGQSASVLVLQGRINGRLKKCPRCGDDRQPVGFSMMPRLQLALLTERQRKAPLSRIGLRTGDVVRLSDSEREAWIELSGEFAKQ
jgi:molybdopterin/thiamine biosynthesis adenylyltransferase